MNQHPGIVENTMLIKEANMGIDRGNMGIDQGNMGIDRTCEQCYIFSVQAVSS